VSGVLSGQPTFAAFAGATLAVARHDYGAKSDAAAAVKSGWEQVGVTPRVSKRVAAQLAAD
jgi:Zn-dependent metalloprotease